MNPESIVLVAVLIRPDLTTYEAVKWAGFTWTAAKKHLSTLQQQGLYGWKLDPKYGWLTVKGERHAKRLRKKVSLTPPE